MAASNNNPTLEQLGEWTNRAIDALRDPAQSKGIHVVYSSFNAAFRVKFPGLDVRKVVDAMAERDLIAKQMRRGGPMIYHPGEGPTRNTTAEASKALAKIDKPTKGSK